MMTAVRPSPIEREAMSLLIAKGFAVMPMRPCFPTRHKPAHLMARRTMSELLYLKLKQTARPLAGIPATEKFCLNDARLLRQLFPLGSKTTILHLEIWIRDDAGRFTCLEVLAVGLREVSHV